MMIFLSKKHPIVLFFSLFLIVSCNSSDSNSNNTQKAITAEEASKIAERFVATQGYTDQKVSVSSAILLEEGEFATDTSKILALRHNTFEKKAVGAKTYEGVYGKSWVVGFNYVPPENNIVAAVAMDSVGKHLRVQNKAVRYDWLVKKDNDEQ